MGASFTEDQAVSKIHHESGHLIWVGWALVLVGVAPLILPLITGHAATQYVGWALVLSGAILIARAFWIRQSGRFFAALLFGALSLASGVFIVSRPMGGEFAVSVCLGIVFLVQGAFEIALGFHTRPLAGWGWMLVSALASIVMSVVVIVSGWQGLSLPALGAIVGVNFLSSGLAFLTIGGAARSAIRVR